MKYPDPNQDDTIVLLSRQVELLERIVELLENAQELLKNSQDESRGVGGVGGVE